MKSTREEDMGKACIIYDNMNNMKPPIVFFFDSIATFSPFIGCLSRNLCHCCVSTVHSFSLCRIDYSVRPFFGLCYDLLRC